MNARLGKARTARGPRRIGLSATVGWGTLLVFACGAKVEPTVRQTRIQAAEMQDGFLACPEPLEPSFWSDGVLICTDGSISVDQIPEHVCADAGLSSCDTLEPVLEPGLPDLGSGPGSGAGPVMDKEGRTRSEKNKAANNTQASAETNKSTEANTGTDASPEMDSDPDPAIADERCADFNYESLVAETRDADCDVITPDECPAGTHIDWSSDSACALCVADAPSNRTCAWAAACFRPFIESVAHSSGAKSCAEDADCSGMRISAGCGEPVTIALRASINEELSMIAEMYAKQNCSLCGDVGGEYELLPAERCIEGVCQL